MPWRRRWRRQGSSKATGYRLETDPRPPSAKRKRRGSRRPDPLGGLFERLVVPLLERNPGYAGGGGLRGIAEAASRAAGRDSADGRTAGSGVEGAVRSRARGDLRAETPGGRGYSDFTAMAKLGVTVAGEPLPHLLYRFRLPYSGFKHARVVLGDESRPALMAGLQEAAWVNPAFAADHGLRRPSRADRIGDLPPVLRRVVLVSSHATENAGGGCVASQVADTVRPARLRSRMARGAVMRSNAAPYLGRG